MELKTFRKQLLQEIRAMTEEDIEKALVIARKIQDGLISMFKPEQVKIAYNNFLQHNQKFESLNDYEMAKKEYFKEEQQPFELRFGLIIIVLSRMDLSNID
jgi:hypothetical protein